MVIRPYQVSGTVVRRRRSAIIGEPSAEGLSIVFSALHSGV